MMSNLGRRLAQVERGIGGGSGEPGDDEVREAEAMSRRNTEIFAKTLLNPVCLTMADSEFLQRWEDGEGERVRDVLERHRHGRRLTEAERLERRNDQRARAWADAEKMLATVDRNTMRTAGLV